MTDRRRLGLVWPLVVGMSVLVLAVVIFLGSGASSANSSQIAFVSFEQLVDAYKKTELVKMGMRQEMTTKLEEVKQAEEELQGRQEELQFLNRDNDEFSTKSLEIAVERFRLRYRAEGLEAEWNANVVKAYTEIVGDIDREIAAIAKERGYIAVLRSGGSGLTGAEADEKEVVSRLSLRHTLYSDSVHDITAEILSRLNRE